MKISVIIPVYNRQQEAIRAVRSVLAQDYDDLELIIVDDCSSPPFDLPAELKEDNNIHLLVHKVNKGAAGARNTGIGHARGDYIALLDSDDVWRVGKLAAQMQEAERLLATGNNPLTAIVCGFRLKSAVTEKDTLLQPVASDRLSDFVSGCWFCPGSTLLVARAAFELVGPYDETLRRLEDTDWFIRLAINGGGVTSVDGFFVDIEAGTKAHKDVVQASGQILVDKFSGDTKIGLNRKHLRLLKSYLALEAAASQVAHGNKPGAAISLLKSFLLKPRLTLQLGRWWT